MSESVFYVSENQVGERLDKIISSEISTITRSSLQKLFEDGLVFVNNKIAKKNDKPKLGDFVKVDVPAPRPLEAVPQNIPVEIVYEDEFLLVVNKPKGMVVHPAAGNPDNTLVNALLYHCEGRLSSINGIIRPGIVHRIDKDTSGLLIVAKNDEAHLLLASQIQQHSFKREYRAVVVGRMPQEEGTINLPIGRCKNDRKKQAVNGINSRNAVTHYKVLEHYPGYDYCSFILETGRTHQIRVHSSYIGHPIVGDMVYSNIKSFTGLEGQCLHAMLIGFIHPKTKEYMEFKAPLPQYFEKVLKIINK